MAFAGTTGNLGHGTVIGSVPARVLLGMTRPTHIRGDIAVVVGLHRETIHPLSIIGATPMHPPHERYRNDEEANGNTQEELASLLPGEEKSCHGLDDRQILEPLQAVGAHASHVP